MTTAWRCLTERADPVGLQLVCDALDACGVAWRVENAGMRALLPLTGVTDARVMVAVSDWERACQALRDLEPDDSGEGRNR